MSILREETVTEPVKRKWWKVVEAIEDSLPVYEVVSEKISLNRARSLRKYALDQLTGFETDFILDVGVGPGTSSKMLLSAGFQQVIGVDPSKKLLEHTHHILDPKKYHMVQSVAEHLPFRTNIVSGVLTCFALRDTLNLEVSLSEFARVTKPRGCLCIVDIGKPDNRVLRAMVIFYVNIGMPIISWIYSRRKIKSNPFLMILPTFESLVTNQTLANVTRKFFEKISIHSTMLGGLIVIIAQQPVRNTG